MTISSKLAEKMTAIPCRGCLANCKFISKCEGKPWRMTDLEIADCLKPSEINNQSAS